MLSSLQEGRKALKGWTEWEMNELWRGCVQPHNYHYHYQSRAKVEVILPSVLLCLFWPNLCRVTKEVKDTLKMKILPEVQFGRFWSQCEPRYELKVFMTNVTHWFAVSVDKQQRVILLLSLGGGLGKCFRLYINLSDVIDEGSACSLTARGGSQVRKWGGTHSPAATMLFFHWEEITV